MPEPQRTRAILILGEVAKAHGHTAAQLVTHMPTNLDGPYIVARKLAMRRIHSEVEGVSVRMLSRAFRRDAHRVRDALRDSAP